MRVITAKLKNVMVLMQGIVAKRSAPGTKTAIPLFKIRQTIFVVTRNQMVLASATSVSDALIDTSSTFTNYLGLSNRNAEVVVHLFHYVTRNELRDTSSNLKGASVQFNVNNPTLSSSAVAKRRISTPPAAASSPQSAITGNTWYSAPLAACSHFTVGILLLSGREEKLATTLTRGT
ncbi:hypothetical protein XBO1_2570030 [Xenorhabdus bovienii str. oregonense]|uniref:Uncharacterized protein n=1 Tax=Xenorhabdus bovienii str. oregonense TaxID=1398202 RepID=A0A077P9A3_XENBV|nr:hypothetical protein [Xenorhabdus bovienii]CDH07213.1 hypothetical protein XBO1_2570030 [Xenorhabdus bovienii str. oregonense]